LRAAKPGVVHAIGIRTSFARHLVGRVATNFIRRDWRKVLGKRSQKGRMNWANYRQLLIAFPLPEPVIHQAWRQ
jgi:hypothetical protein